MKLYLLVFILLTLGCNRGNPYEQATKEFRELADRTSVETAAMGITKIVMLKETAIEQRMTVSLFGANQFENKSVTVYYIVAEDGSSCEVTRREYFKVKVGDRYTSNKWQE